MSEPIKLGTLITTEQGRDAIHIAIAPVVCNVTVFPGQHLGLADGDPGRVTLSEKPVGIVDPYLQGPIFPGQKFWLCLYPLTVTSLRHEWTHPAFVQKPPTLSPMEESKAWMANFAEECGTDYDRLIGAIEDADYIHMGENEHYKTALDKAGDEFKKHCEVILGRKLDCAPYPFSCSC